MHRLLLLVPLLACYVGLQAQLEGEPQLQAAFESYMRMKWAPQPYYAKVIDTLRIFKGDLNGDSLEDAVIDWRAGSDRAIAAFLGSPDGYVFGADDSGVWIRQQQYVFTPYTIDWAGLRGTVHIEKADEEGKTRRYNLAPSYVAKYREGSLLGSNASNLICDARHGNRIKDMRDLLIVSWPLHHLGGSGILWDLRIFWARSTMTWDQRHRFLQIVDPLGSEMEDTTILMAKVFPGKQGRQLLVVTWQEGSNAEWDSQDHWAAYWDHGLWIPAMDSVLPPLDGRIFFDMLPEDVQELRHQGWQVALHLSPQKNEIIVEPANRIENIQAVYPELVSKMQAQEVRYVWNRHLERFEAQPSGR